MDDGLLTINLDPIDEERLKKFAINGDSRLGIGDKLSKRGRSHDLWVKERRLI